MRNVICILVLCVLAACDVSVHDESTGGVGPSSSPSTDTNAAEPGSGCPSALVVANSDYQSTTISVVDMNNVVQSAAMISSGSASTGLSGALSGDVVLPSQRVASERIVLIDRYGSSITWVDPARGAVIGQASVATEYRANPHDYVEVSPTKAYVSRFESNRSPGRVPYDQGGDLLILDPEDFAVTGRIDLGATPPAYYPRPDRMLRLGNRVWVTLTRHNADFTEALDARVVGVTPDSDAVSWTLDLPGLANCGTLALSPDASVIALACSGVLGNYDDEKRRGGIVLLDAKSEPPVEIRRFSLADHLKRPIGSTLAFAGPETLLGVALGDMQAKTNDIVYALDTESGNARVLAEAGGAFAFGDVLCSPHCTRRCWLADAHQGIVRTWHTNGASLEPGPSIKVDTVVGLPPRFFGTY